ncbi:MAG: 1-phosphofructokinase family hexose kinase [Clostridia bacterium]|nr:1-phosphofructokinase family hexose kinase [Clostridia bacterium]
MITTICMNPSFDKTVEVDSLSLGHVNRIRTSRTDVGGKGINVAVVARRLGIDARVIGVAGTDGIGRICDEMDKEGVQHAFLPVDGSVRINTKVVSLDGSGVTELNESGPMMTAEVLAEFFALAREKTMGSDYAVITGSLPPGCPPGTCRELIRALNGVRCILDVGGNELTLGVDAKPFLIKPNHHELAAALRTEMHTLEDIRRGAQSFVDAGVEHVVVSLGRDGAMYVGHEGAFYVPEVPVEVHSTVGAGDAMVGGLLYGLLKDGTVLSAMRYGAAAGTASVMTEGTQLIVPDDFLHLIDRVQVQVL